MLPRLWCIAILFAFGYNLNSQSSFNDKTDTYLADIVVRSTLPVGVFDLDGDYHDDIVVLNNGNILSTFLNQGKDQSMQYLNLKAPVSGIPEWSFAAGDLDNDGIPEVIVTGVYNNIKVYKFDPSTNEFSLSQKLRSEAYGQGSNIADINGDGYNDYFLCHDEGESRLFYNDGTGKLDLKEGVLDFSTDPESDMSGNYGSEWVDLDDDGILEMYMAKCSVRANEYTDPRRINQLLKRNDQGIYSDIADSLGLAKGDQSWAATFSDLDNDGDLDCVLVNHHSPHMVLENQNGIFTVKDIGVGDIVSFAFQVMTADLDNNGYEDILITGGSDFVLYNFGGFIFELQEEVFNYFDIHSAAIGDLNNDGFCDAYVSYGIPILEPGNRKDAIWINSGNENHFLKFSFKGVNNNRSAIGTKVKVFNGLGCQQRNIKGGQSYGIVNSFNVHFGMGTETAIDSVLVVWPGGNTDIFYDIGIDNHYIIEEGGCITEVVNLGDEPQGICMENGNTIDLSIENASDVVWSNGATGNSITIDQPGSYKASGSNQSGCPVITTILPVEELAIDTYSLSPLDTVVICFGDSIGSAVQGVKAYTWNTGEDSPHIYPAEEGRYAVSVTDYCGNTFEDVLEVEFHHEDFAGYIDTIMKNDTAVLTIQGQNIRWFKDNTTSDVLMEGDTLITSPLERDTAFYAESVIFPEAKRTNVGIATSEESTPYASDNLNAVMRFDVLGFITINTVTCYTDTIGEREIIIIDQDSTEHFRKRILLDSGENIITLGVNLDPGSNYRITTDRSINQASLGYNGPRLHRSSEDVFYPYKAEGLLSIEGSENGPNYYYFYNWEVESRGEACISDRVEVKVVVDFSEAVRDDISTALSIFPNPSSEYVKIENRLHRGDMRILVYSVNGELLEDHQDPPSEVILDISRYMPGVYFIQIRDNKRTVTKKFIKIGR